MLTVTIVSVVLAAVSGLVAWRALRREHLRGEARVASLAATIDEVSAVERTFEWPSEDEPRVTSLASVVEEPANRRRPLLTAGAGLAVVLTVVVLIAMMADNFPNGTVGASDPPASVGRGGSGDPLSSRGHSLELISMRSVREGSTLAVSGLVRNRSTAAMSSMTALVAAMDADGKTLGTGTIAIDPMLPGARSLFVVTIPKVATASHYRVSFQDASGVIRHLDRRGSQTDEL